MSFKQVSAVSVACELCERHGPMGKTIEEAEAEGVAIGIIRADFTPGRHICVDCIARVRKMGGGK